MNPSEWGMNQPARLDLLYDDATFVIDNLKCESKECGNYLIPPILQCIDGHSLCVMCTGDNYFDCCPVCMNSLSKTRCLTLEAMVKKLLLPCKNEKFGCVIVVPHETKEHHERNCLFGTAKCLNAACHWVNQRNALWDHLMNKHPEDVVTGNQFTVEIPVEIQESCVLQKMIKFLNGLFVTKIAYDQEKESYYGGVRRFDTAKIGPTFYTFSVSTTVGKGERTYQFTREAHRAGDRFARIFNTDDCFVLPQKFARFFADSSPNLVLCVSLTKTKINSPI